MGPTFSLGKVQWMLLKWRDGKRYCPAGHLIFKQALVAYVLLIGNSEGH